ncbi:MAG: hypothetical protein M1416_03135 [Candidatus Pacearchaeota archaeon]|nr:hypothetical protein [Candidatus Pacearchaeota archaeon]
MESEELIKLKEEINSGEYSRKTVSEFFTFAPSEEFKEAYGLLVEFNKRYAEDGFIAKKVKEGFTEESARRALTCSYLLNFIDEEVIKHVLPKISDLETAKKKGIESLLI